MLTSSKTQMHTAINIDPKPAKFFKIYLECIAMQNIKASYNSEKKQMMIKYVLDVGILPKKADKQIFFQHRTISLK